MENLRFYLKYAHKHTHDVLLPLVQTRANYTLNRWGGGGGEKKKKKFWFWGIGGPKRTLEGAKN